MIGIDKRLLNISRLDGGYGLTINGRPAMRAKIGIKRNENKAKGYTKMMYLNSMFDAGYRDYMGYTRSKI